MLEKCSLEKLNLEKKNELLSDALETLLHVSIEWKAGRQIDSELNSKILDIFSIFKKDFKGYVSFF